jgi:hypothetical protein
MALASLGAILPVVIPSSAKTRRNTAGVVENYRPSRPTCVAGPRLRAIASGAFSSVLRECLNGEAFSVASLCPFASGEVCQ